MVGKAGTGIKIMIFPSQTVPAQNHPAYGQRELAHPGTDIITNVDSDRCRTVDPSENMAVTSFATVTSPMPSMHAWTVSRTSAGCDRTPTVRLLQRQPVHLLPTPTRRSNTPIVAGIGPEWLQMFGGSIERLHEGANPASDAGGVKTVSVYFETVGAADIYGGTFRPRTGACTCCFSTGDM